MESICLSASELDDWWTYYDRAGKPGPYHRPDYLQLLTGHFEHDDEQPELFVLDDGDDLVYYPYIRRSLESVPFTEDADTDLAAYDDIVSSWYWGGPFTSRKDGELCERFTEAFNAHCRAENIVAEFLRFDPNEENHERFECLEPSFNRETVWVDLSAETDALWDGFEKRNRNAIRQAQDTAIEVTPATDRENYLAFHDIYSNAMDAKDASNHYRFDVEFFVDLLGSDLGTLLIATYEDDVIGGSMLVHDERIAHDYLRASNPDYWDMRVNNLLCYEAMMHMRETGRERFDFQGGRPGVFKFKKSFSPDRGELYLGRVRHMPEVYDDLVAQAEDAGIETDSGYFPAYRVEKSN
jgi:hypothetical protein